jgi:hypothetical protein
MAVSKTDLKFYLTSLEPDIAQANKSQSIGGYVSTSTVFSSTTLSASVGLYDTSLTLSDYTNISGLTYLAINNEIIETDVVSSNEVVVKTRAINGLRNFHANGDTVFGLSVDDLFNQKFNDDLKQYRCIAIKNENVSDTALNVAAYIKQQVVNDSSLTKMAVEYPKNDYHSGNATGGSKMSVINSSISGTFNDEHFTDAILKMTSGNNINQSRIVSSYDAGGTFVLQSSLPFTVSSNDAYEVAAGPAQRAISALVSPTVGGSRTSLFSEASSSEFISLDVDGARSNGSSLLPNGVLYIWLERGLVKDTELFSANSSIVSVNYFTA